MFGYFSYKIKLINSKTQYNFFYSMQNLIKIILTYN